MAILKDIINELMFRSKAIKNSKLHLSQFMKKGVIMALETG
jgi:hypothetical protein